jgi:hypothetical protein
MSLISELDYFGPQTPKKATFTSSPNSQQSPTSISHEFGNADHNISKRFSFPVISKGASPTKKNKSIGRSPF